MKKVVLQDITGFLLSWGSLWFGDGQFTGPFGEAVDHSGIWNAENTPVTNTRETTMPKLTGTAHVVPSCLFRLSTSRSGFGLLDDSESS